VRLASTPVISRRNNRIPLFEFTHLATLRRTFLVAGIFAAFVIALLGFVYWKTKGDLTMRPDHVIASQLDAFAALIAWLKRPQDRGRLGKPPSRFQDRQCGAKRCGRQGRRKLSGETGASPDRATFA
jgi:hypothetical protein